MPDMYITDGVYQTYFFSITFLHGFHVMLGSIIYIIATLKLYFLIINYYTNIKIETNILKKNFISKMNVNLLPKKI
jgi:heme/copper-type cytochrome/quinol oxidase subunit 3